MAFGERPKYTSFKNDQSSCYFIYIALKCCQWQCMHLCMQMKPMQQVIKGVDGFLMEIKTKHYVLLV